MTEYNGLIRKQGYDGPIAVMVSLVGTLGRRYTVDRHTNQTPRRVDRNELILPDALIEDENSRIDDALRGVFDAFWQSAGFPRSFGYDQDGNWVDSEHRH